MNHRRNFIKKPAITGAGIPLLPNLGWTNSLAKTYKKIKSSCNFGVGLRGTNHLDNLLRKNDVV